MMKTKMVLVYAASLLCCILGFSGCNNAVYNEHLTVKDILTWKKGEVISFQVPIKDATVAYELVAALRHHSSIKYSVIEIGMVMTGPNGFSKEGLYKIPLRDAEGFPIGSAAGDICDTETTLESNFKFPEPGTYSVSLAPALDTQDQIEGIMEVGFMVEKPEGD